MEIALQQKGIMQMTLEQASKTDLIRQFSKLSVKNIVENAYPTLFELKKTYGEDKTEKVTAIVFKDLSESFGGELTDLQIVELAIETSSSDFQHMSLEDIYYVCRSIKKEKHFGKLNVNKLMTELNKHADERFEAVMEYNRNKDIERFRECERQPCDEGAAKRLSEMQERIHKKLNIPKKK